MNKLFEVIDKPDTDVSYLLEHNLGNSSCPFDVGHLAEPDRDGVQYWVLNCGARVIKSKIKIVRSLA